ncbi:hypothetical protein SAMN04244579_02979 [Azotobacter beijerinckii]|uniref:Uncharacterized protein n=2 Tax=Azotobacter beijerinckii TaxID=170623 RepID=A0A1H6VTD4_9GAMM|nr:hypothetical protein SAMN04244579_02979 [Azotobacter beijerinckii]
MTMSRYQIVFSGQLVHGASPELVQANLAKLFRADAARIATLFSGRRVPLKGNLEADEAEKYRAALARAGARVDILPMEEEAPLAPRQETDLSADRSHPTRRPLVVVPRDAYMAAFAAVEAPDFGIAAAGADLLEPKPAAVPPCLDLSGLSLAPVGSDMGPVPAAPAGPLPDISGLHLEAP